jgi:integrase
MRKSHRLSALAVERMNRPGKLHDGGGLYLIASPRTGPDARGVSKRWQLRLNVPTEPGIKRKWRWAGCGGYPDVSLQAAREQASKMRAMMRQGVDPIVERRKAKAAALKATRSARTLDQAFEACLADRVATAGWKNGTSSAQWRSEHRRYIEPEIGSTLVEEITVADVLRVVRPHWTKMPVLADRLLSRLEQVIAYAIAHGWRAVAAGNPAEQARVLLPKHKTVHKVEHYAALPAKEMPAFMRKVRSTEGVAARAIELLTLTVLRSAELINADWSWVKDGLLVVPGRYMKGQNRDDHAVPLSRQAVALLETLRPANATSGRIFPGLTRSMLSKAFGRLELAGTLHGLRAVFSTHCNEARLAPSDVIEHALAHKGEDDVKLAYDRGTRAHPRIALMRAWANFLDCPKADDNVTPLPRRA